MPVDERGDCLTGVEASKFCGHDTSVSHNGVSLIPLDEKAVVAVRGFAKLVVNVGQATGGIGFQLSGI